MKTVKAFAPRDLRVVTVPDPEPGAGEVLIKVGACGICGSDKWYWNVTEPTDTIAGHEAAGEVCAVGVGVHHLRVGDRVAVNNVKGCGQCPACHAGAFTRCIHPLTHMGNGFSELIAVPERNCLLLDGSVSDVAGCLIFDMCGTPYAALERAQVGAGTDLVVFGCGPIGLAAVMLAAIRGAYIVAVDPVADRREAALRLGANAAFPPDDRIVSEIRGLTSGLGGAVVLECSGKASAYDAAFPALRTGGTLVSLGEGARLEVQPSQHLIHRHLNWFGSLYSTMEHGKSVQDLMVRRLIDPATLVTHRFTREELPRVFGSIVDIADGILKAVVIPSN